MAAWEPLWPVVGPMLAPSIARGDASLDEVLEALGSGHAQLWIAHEGEAVWMAMLTQCGGGAVHIWHLGGRGPARWLHLIDELKRRASERGFAKLTVEGRKGWQRLLAPYGFTAAGGVLEAVL